MATIIDYIGLSSDIKDFVVNANVDFKDISLKNMIFNSNDNDLLRIKKSIGSKTTIISVDIVDDDFVMRAVLGTD